METDVGPGAEMLESFLPSKGRVKKKNCEKAVRLTAWVEFQKRAELHNVTDMTDISV